MRIRSGFSAGPSAMPCSPSEATLTSKPCFLRRRTACRRCPRCPRRRGSWSCPLPIVRRAEPQAVGDRPRAAWREAPRVRRAFLRRILLMPPLSRRCASSSRSAAVSTIDRQMARLLVPTELIDELEAVHLRHHQVEENEVGLDVRQAGPARRARSRPRPPPSRPHAACGRAIRGYGHRPRRSAPAARLIGAAGGERLRRRSRSIGFVR